MTKKNRDDPNPLSDDVLTLVEGIAKTLAQERHEVDEFASAEEVQASFDHNDPA